MDIQQSQGEEKLLDMHEVKVALDAAMDDNSEDNMAALLRATDFEVSNLADLALDHQNTGRAATLLLSTAVTMADNKASDAEDKAAEAQVQAAEAHRQALIAQTNCDGVFQRNSENTHTILAQASELCQHARRIAAIETLLPCAPAPPVSSHSIPSPPPSAVKATEGDRITAVERQLAIAMAHIHALEQGLDKHREVVEKSVLQTTPGHEDTMDNLMGRIQVLADMRQEAEKNEFEHEDRLRQQKIDSFKRNLAMLKKENVETKAALAELQAQFRRMRTFFVAFFDGDLTQQEVIVFLPLCLTRWALANMCLNLNSCRSV